MAIGVADIERNGQRLRRWNLAPAVCKASFPMGIPYRRRPAHPRPRMRSLSVTTISLTVLWRLFRSRPGIREIIWRDP